MAVRIRLTRVGATKRPAYRVIAIDQRRSRDGRALEILGFYDPLTEPATVQLETDKITAWIGKGAQPSDTVVRLMRQAETAASQPTPAEKPKRASRPKAASKAAPRAAAGRAAGAAAASAGEDAPPATPNADGEAAPAAQTDATGTPGGGAEDAAGAAGVPEQAEPAEPGPAADADAETTAAGRDA